MRGGILLALAALSFFALRGEEDQSVRAAADDDVQQRGEPLYRWWGKPERRRKIAPPPGENPRMYARVTLAADHGEPSVIAFTSEARGTYMSNFNTHFLHKGGLSFSFDYWKNARTRGWTPFKPGETSQWIDITPALHYGYLEVLRIRPRRASGYHGLPANVKHSFVVEFSTDAKTVIGRFASGGGCFASGTVSLRRGTARSDVELSAADLSLALKAGRRAPKRPRRIMVGMANHVSPATLTPPAYTNELKVLRLLGVNDAREPMNGALDPNRRWEPEFLRRGPHIANRHLGCLCSPDYVSITNDLLKLKASCEGPLSRGKKLVVSIMDEPYYSLSMLTNCRSRVKTCRERYGRDFCYDPANVKEHLATIDYRDRVVAGFYKTVKEIAQSVHSNILISANVGISIVFGGNVCAPGTSPFMLTDAGAINVGLTEDWSNVQRTRQFCSYVSDVYRAAMERHALDFVLYSVILSREETGAKAYSEIGHGAKGLYFFAYGPHWLGGDNRNTRAWLYPTIRQFCEATAAAEDALYGARVAKGDAALLFSESCDRLEIIPGQKRNWIERNPYGKDRMSASLMLLHCGVRTDVLCEDDVLKKLSRYRTLVATDRRVRADGARAIAAWMRAGGTLLRTKGALAADEYDRPLPEGLLSGAGKIVELDFSPWRQYVRPAKQTTGGCYSHRDFDRAILGRMESAVKAARITRRIHSDHPFVEAMLLENAANGKSVIVLSNWSVESPRQTTVTLRRSPRFSKVWSASGAKIRRGYAGGATFTLDVGLGDYLVLEP